MTLTPQKTGWIEVICGPMFSGKTEELIRRLVRAQIAKQRVAIFKPTTDNRFSEDYIVSHNQRKIKSIQVEKTSIILDYKNKADVTHYALFLTCLCLLALSWWSKWSFSEVDN